MRITPVVSRLSLICLLLGTVAVPNFAQSSAFDGAEAFMTDFQDFLNVVAVISATCGFLGLAIIQFGTPFPIIGDWKKDNPKAVKEVVMGLVFLIFISLGGLAALGVG